MSSLVLDTANVPLADLDERIEHGSDLLTIQEAAEWLKTSRRTVYAWMREGKLAFVRIPSGRRRLLRSDLARHAAPKDSANG